MDSHLKNRAVFYYFFRCKNIEAFFLSIGEVASLLGVCTKTLRKWEVNGAFKSDFRTIGNHRRYKKARILNILRKRAQSPKTTRCAHYNYNVHQLTVQPISSNDG
ncbi:MAG: MerR family DNA-binding transcriptional regulator [Promethearchaeota archaeon]